MQRRPDWDREGRERRAREHGRERGVVDARAVDDLDAIIAARAQREDEFHDLAEPARLVASAYRRILKGERWKHYPVYVARLRAEIEKAVEATPSPALKARLVAYGKSLEKRFVKKSERPK